MNTETPEGRLLETVSDISYLAGHRHYHSGDSRADVQSFIEWAKEFEKLRQVDAAGNETYNGDNYMTAIEKFALPKLNQ